MRTWLIQDSRLKLYCHLHTRSKHFDSPRCAGPLSLRRFPSTGRSQNAA
jgi:hypothetical protein